MDKGLCGLVNNSSFCYMNSSIQCLSNTVPFTLFFLNKEYLNFKNIQLDKFYLVENWFKLIEGLWQNNCVISPISFLKSIFLISHENNYIFHNNQQQDACEFIIFLIEQLHNLLKIKINYIEKQEETKKEEKEEKEDKEEKKENYTIYKIAEKKWFETLNFNESIITTLFYGQYISIIETTDSLEKEISYSFEPFFPLQLNIPEKETPENNITLELCLNDMILENVLDGDNKWFNEKINQYVNAKKKILIFKSPSILMIQFKRFNYNNEKKNNLIEFPIDILNFDKYLFYEKNVNYRLYAVINHFGNCNAGHYTNFCRNLNGKWYHYDDSNVMEIEKEDIITNKAYCLFYEKI